MFGYKFNFPRTKKQLMKALKRPTPLPTLRYPDSGVVQFRSKQNPWIRFLYRMAKK